MRSASACAPRWAPGARTSTPSTALREGASITDNIADPVYRISHVLDYDGSCPADGTWGIELKHEPDDAVYCMEIAQ